MSANIILQEAFTWQRTQNFYTAAEEPPKFVIIN